VRVHLQQQEEEEGDGSTTASGGSSQGRIVPDAAQSTLVLEGELASVQELGFAFRRAASRLVEMGGAPYHATHAATWPQAPSLLPSQP
jgi:hypothetical protein